ncbi:MAG: M56 family metallopeptidase, partial [Candidatus Limnocylindrales bacterium]
MIDALVGVGVSNLLLSAGVGLLAYAVHRRERDPALAHLLWVLTLVAAVTPPLLLWSVPILPATVASQASVASATDASIVDVGVAAGSWLAANLASVLLGVWAAGSLAVLVASAQRIVRFGILLRRSCRPAPEGVQRLAAAVAYELDMRTVPSIHVSAARLAPMTWWSGGRARVVLPEALRSEVDEAQLRWILAHELAHIKRHDHLVRWLEWLASVAFWWNPVVWWARRHLRRDEEDACDALVLEHLQGQPRDYARTLLTVVEVMAAPAGNAPALATGLDAARSLEHRFSRIVSPAPSARTPRAIASGSVVVAVLLMTVGVGLDETPPSTAVADTPSTTPGSSSSSLSTPGPAVESAPRARTAPLPGLEPLGAATTTLQVS